MTIYMNIPKEEIKEFHDGLDFLTYLMGKEFTNPAKEYYNVTQFNAACNVLHRIREAAEEGDKERRERYKKASKAYNDRLRELQETDAVLSMNLKELEKNDDGTPRLHLDFDL